MRIPLILAAFLVATPAAAVDSRGRFRRGSAVPRLFAVLVGMWPLSVGCARTRSSHIFTTHGDWPEPHINVT